MMASYSRSAQQWATFARMWYLIDGKMQPPGKIASLCAVHLKGKHKPTYHALSDCGDHVVVINTRHIAFSGNKWEQKVYSSHTGYPGGFRQVTAAELHRRDPTAIVKLAVYGMLPKNLHRRTMMQRLHLFAENLISKVKISRHGVGGLANKCLNSEVVEVDLAVKAQKDIPEDIRKNLVTEIQQPRIVPKRLDEYSQDEIDAFPRLWTPPSDYLLK